MGGEGEYEGTRLVCGAKYLTVEDGGTKGARVVECCRRAVVRVEVGKYLAVVDW